jgi:hypothetical protein
MRMSSLPLLVLVMMASAWAAGCSGAEDGVAPGQGQAAGDVDAAGGGGDGDGGGGGAGGNGGGGGGGGAEDAAAGTHDGAAGSNDAATKHDSGAHDAGTDANAACLPAVPSPGSGHHNAGADCAQCHDSLGASRRWTIAGTLYASAAGGSAVGGATIEIVDANGTKLDLHTYANGNFYTTQVVKFPLHVRASKCPGSEKMVAAAGAGSCNASGCHASMRIHP